MARDSLAWGRAVCEALGLDPNMVQSITIEMNATRPLTVTVHLAPDLDPEPLAAQIREHVERVELVPSMREVKFG